MELPPENKHTLMDLGPMYQISQHSLQNVLSDGHHGRSKISWESPFKGTFQGDVAFPMVRYLSYLEILPLKLQSWIC